MKKRKWFLIASVLVVLSMLFSACASPTEEPATEEPTTEEEAVAEPVTIDVWFHSGKGEEREVLDEQVTTFNEMQNEVFVNAIQLPEGSYNDQVSAGALAGDLPCLLDFDGPFLYNYAWSGYLTPLDDYVSQELKDDFLPSIIDQGTYGGKLYSLGTFDSGLA
ncbi:MAG: ABC transporter substrate-binding protein, partial [Anaerolineales bacterium]